MRASGTGQSPPGELLVADAARSPERGASLVEAAFVLPIVLVLLFGVVEFGRYLSMSQGVSTAAREAARYGIAAGDNGSGTPRYADCQGIIDAGKELSGLGAVVDADFTVTYEDGDGNLVADCDSSNNPTPPDPSDSVIEDGYLVIVEVERPFDELIPFTGILLPDTVSANDQRTIFLVD